MNKLIGILLVSTIILSGKAMADGNELLKDCKSAINSYENNKIADWEAGRCLGTMQGVIEMDEFLATVQQRKNGIICLPSGVKRDQAARVIVKFLEDNPANLNASAGALTALALSISFPCK